MKSEIIKIENITQAKNLMQNKNVRIQVHSDITYYYVDISKKAALSLIEAVLEENDKIEFNLIGDYACYIYIKDQQ